MGALHAGHAANFRVAKDRGDVVLASVFVNPRQFSDDEDLARYPRTPAHDHELARESGVDCLVEPALNDMWPDFPRATPTTVTIRPLGERFEGADRPGHFDGVASVVAKLFAITGPCRAYFGEKDYQQLCVVRQLVRDLAFDVEIVPCPIVRDEQGLALSSRNERLSPEGRERALGLSRALREVAIDVASSLTQRTRLRAVMEDHGIEVAYAEVVDPATLEPVGANDHGVKRALVAGFVEGVRLLDNGPVEVGG